MKNLFLFFLMIAGTLTAQSVDSLFTAANNFYKNGNFEKAIENYHQIEAKEQQSAALFYNLGNAYYKLNKVGPTIYYYEKALKINPQNKDVLNNLVFAKRLAIDTIEELPKTFFQKLNKKYIQRFSYNQWAVVVVVFSGIATLLFLLFYFAESPVSRRVYFTFSSLGFLGLILSFIITYNTYNFSKNNLEAIVFAEKTNIRNAPTLNSEVVFILHEGTKVTVLDAIDNWEKIKLADGKIGWIQIKDVKKI